MSRCMLPLVCLMLAAGTSAHRVLPATGRMLLQPLETPIHNDTVIGNVRAYVSYLNSSTAPNNTAVVVFPDEFGYADPYVRRWADALAQEGFIVIVPDVLQGDYLPAHPTPDEYQAWSARHPHNMTAQLLAGLFEGINKTFTNVSKIGTEGFSYGSYCATLTLEGPAPYSDAGVLYGVLPFDATDITRPIAIIEYDPSLPDTLNLTSAAEVNATVQQLQARGIPANITYFPGEVHGFVLEHDELFGVNQTVTTEQEQADMDAAYNIGVTWLAHYLNVSTV